MKIIHPLPLLLTALVLGTSLGQADITVASLSTITTDLAKNIGGDHVKVIEIIRSGIDPHEYQPTTRDVRRVADADMVLYTGKGMEGFLTKLREAAGTKVQFVDVGTSIPSLSMTEEGHKVEDPHWWHSVDNMKRATRTVADAFGKADPANAAAYGRNAETYLASLDELQRWIRVKLAELPCSKRKLVTSHDALGYFARDYGFTILPVKGVSTGEEPSSKHVKELIGVIRTEGVKSYFLESIESDRAVYQIGSETGARAGGILYSDSLGETEASTYDSMMRHNVTTIVDGLK